MDRTEAKKKIVSCLKERNIQYFEHIHASGSCIVVLLTGYSQCPDSALEVSFEFFDTDMECNIYYTENASSWIEERADDLSDLYRLMNFINARVFPSCRGSGYMLYSPHILYTPRIYLTADGCFDITITTIIPYDFFGLAPLETLDYITICCPELLDRLALPIYCVLLGKETADGAISHIEREFLKT